MARKTGQIIRRGSSTWLVRIYVGRDPETRRRKYIGKFIHGGLRSAQAHLRPLRAVKLTNLPWSDPYTPLSVPIHNFPCESARIALMANPPSSVVPTRSFRMRLRPFVVPTQMVPSRSSQSAVILSAKRPSFAVR